MPERDPLRSAGDFVIDVEAGDGGPWAYKSFRTQTPYTVTASGDFVVRTGETERGRIKADGTTTGAFASPLTVPSTGTNGAPVSGTWLTHQLAIDSTNRIWLCTAGGTPGTWTFWRPVRRINSIVSSATPAINTDTTDIFEITALAVAITSMTTNLTGTPDDGDSLIVRITDNGTGRTIAWGSSFESSTIALPTTTVASTLLTVGLFWNTATSKWRCVAVA